MVNTFLPYGDFKKVARVLDSKRLGKQRVEARQILDIITGKAKYTAWKSHPVVFMWRGHADALKDYINEMITEWKRRGYSNNMPLEKVKPYEMPWFVTCKTVNYSHRASLLRKYPEHYSKYFKVPSDYMRHSYVWSKHLTDEQIATLRDSTRPLGIAKYAKSL